MQNEEYYTDEYCVSTVKQKLDIAVIHSYLSRSYWAEDIPMEIVKKGIENALCFGVYKKDVEALPAGRQVGFARVISDYSTFAYLADVFILEEEQGKGLSKWLMECIIKHKQLQGLRNFCLLTRDAHTLYEKFGFKNLEKPQNFMAIKKDNFYKKK